jgi:hypothetical protein
MFFWWVHAADTFMAVEHVGDVSSIRFGLVSCECVDGSLCVSAEPSSREERDLSKWVKWERGCGTLIPAMM